MQKIRDENKILYAESGGGGESEGYGTDRQNRSLCKMLTKAADECIPKTSGPRERQIVPSATKIKPTGL